MSSVVRSGTTKELLISTYPNDTQINHTYITNCLFDNGTNNRQAVVTEKNHTLTITGSTFATAKDKLYSIRGTIVFAGENIINSDVSGEQSPIIIIDDGAVLNLHGNVSTVTHAIAGSTITATNATVIDVNGSTHTINGTGTYINKDGTTNIQ